MLICPILSPYLSGQWSWTECNIRELKQTDAAAVNQQISIQKDSRPSEFSRPLTLFTL